jgi:hypothetical protein
VPAVTEFDAGHEKVDHAPYPDQPPLTGAAPQPRDSEFLPVHWLVPHALPALLQDRLRDWVLPVHVPEQVPHVDQLFQTESTGVCTRQSWDWDWDPLQPLLRVRDRLWVPEPQLVLQAPHPVQVFQVP